MDDRFEDRKKPTETFPFQKDTPWDESMTPEQYFRKAFLAGNQNHTKVQNLRVFYKATYEKVEKEFSPK